MWLCAIYSTSSSQYVRSMIHSSAVKNALCKAPSRVLTNSKSSRNGNCHHHYCVGRSREGYKPPPLHCLQVRPANHEHLTKIYPSTINFNYKVPCHLCYSYKFASGCSLQCFLFLGQNICFNLQDQTYYFALKHCNVPQYISFC